MKEDDLTRSEGAPSPRSLVQFAKISLEMPMGTRFRLEATSPAVIVLLVAIALGISGAIPVIVIATVHGPTWLMALFGTFSMSLTTLSTRRFIRFTWQESEPGGSE